VEGVEGQMINRLQKNSQNPYTMVHNGIIRNPSLSWKAKGIMLYFLSRPDDWTFYEKEVVRNASDGVSAYRAGIKELEAHGYVKRTQVKDEQGKFSHMLYEVFEDPALVQSVLVVGDSPLTENRSTDGSKQRRGSRRSRPKHRHLDTAFSTHAEERVKLIACMSEGTVYDLA
jgi:hypothetical protein